MTAFNTYEYRVRWHGCILSRHRNKEAADRAALIQTRGGLLGVYVERVMVVP